MYVQYSNLHLIKIVSQILARVSTQKFQFHDFTACMWLCACDYISFSDKGHLSVKGHFLLPIRSRQAGFYTKEKCVIVIFFVLQSNAGQQCIVHC